jgi:hypothetical protein
LASRQTRLRIMKWLFQVVKPFCEIFLKNFFAPPYN